MGETAIRNYLETLRDTMSDISWKMMRRHILRKPDLVGEVFGYAQNPVQPTEEDNKTALYLLKEM
jgi:hypothetical protein